jgi:hypothetical protein
MLHINVVGTHKWFPGTVQELISGKDGQPTAVYQILYDNVDDDDDEDEGQCEVDHLHKDWTHGSVKFLDMQW